MPSDRTLDPRLLLAAFLALAAALPAQPDPALERGEQRVGNVVFHLPPDWTLAHRDAVVVITPPAPAGDGRCEIVLLPGQVPQEGFARACERMFDAAFPAAERVDAPAAEYGRDRFGHRTFARRVIHRPGGGGEQITVLRCWQVGRRLECAVFVATPDPFRQHAAAAADFLDHRLRFASDVVLATGAPKLTLWDVECAGDVLAWLLATPLTSEHRGRLRQIYVQAWREDDDATKADLRQLLEAQERLALLNAEQREAARRAALAEAMPKWRADESPLARLCVELHDRPPVAPKGDDAPPVASVKVESAWLRREHKVVVGELGHSVEAQHDFLFFLGDGRVRRRWSNVGLLGLDHDREAAAEPASGWYGKASRAGNEVRVRWSNGGTATFTAAGTTLRPDSGQAYARLPSCDGLLLDGTWVAGGEHMRQQPLYEYVRFTRDGRFEEERLGAAVMRHDAPPRGSGRYSIRDYTLVLKYDHGPEVRFGFYLLGEPRSDAAALYLNTFVFSRR